MSVTDPAVPLRRALLRGPLTATLARHGASLPALADVPDASTLLARIDTAEPYSAARDALLADLLRLHRRCQDAAVLSVLVYALCPSVLRRCLRGTLERHDQAEQVAEVLHALVERLGTYQPGRRSPHVQANLEHDVRRTLWLARRAERQRLQVIETITALAGHAAANDVDAGVQRVENLIERPTPRRLRETEPEAPADVRALVERLVASRLLPSREATLVCLVHAQGRRIAEVASSLGLKGCRLFATAGNRVVFSDVLET